MICCRSRGCEYGYIIESHKLGELLISPNFT